jgi:acetylglutamate kinase
MDEAGTVYNNNADVAAAEVAIAVQARKLVFLSDVHGIMRKPGDESSFIPSIHSGEVDEMIRQGIISGGMLPKVRSGIKAVAAGVKKTHIIDGNLKHSLLLELFTEEGIGTEIVG